MRNKFYEVVWAIIRPIVLLFHPIDVKGLDNLPEEPVVLCANLAAYIAGAAEVMEGLLPVGKTVAMLIFYVLAASVVLFGLKAVAVSEKLMVTAIFVIIGVLANQTTVPHWGAGSLLPGRSGPSSASGPRQRQGHAGLFRYGYALFLRFLLHPPGGGRPGRRYGKGKKGRIPGAGQ